MVWPVHDVVLDGAASVATARQAARQIASRLGLDQRAQTRLAVAVAEAAGNAVTHATGGRVAFVLDGTGPVQLVITVSDLGPGMPGLDSVLDPRSPRAGGLATLRQFVDDMTVTSKPVGTIVRLACTLPDMLSPDIAGLAQLVVAAIAAEPSPDDTAALHRDLLSGLVEIDRLNAELEDTNRGVVALYAELDERADQLRQASELKSRFLSNMSHEFRTPLNSILALARLLLDRADGPLGEEQERQVGYIRRSAESLSELVNDLLDLAKVEAGKLEPRPRAFTVVELFGALRGVMKPLQQSDAVELMFDEATACPALFTDEAKVSQVLRNLISNALKFTERGEVRVAAWFDAENGHAVFTVRDTGIGIAPKDHELVFEEFGQVANRLQGRAKGTGLGLPLSRRLAELLGGTLTLESVPGSGTVFILSVPSILPSALRLPTGGPDPPAPAAYHDVLLIDDEEMSRYLMRQMLAGVPALRILEAENGAHGLRRAVQDRPDLIMLDLRMPGMDGFEVLERLGANPDTQSIPVMICSSSVLESADRARLARARGVLSKSGLSREVVFAAIAPILGRLASDGTLGAV
jgi:signal transduction histidine kinase